jgi:hypothetical protein
VLKTMGLLPRWKTSIFSQQRANNTGGLPKSVIPEQVFDQPAFTFSPAGGGSVTWLKFPQSVFFEVKAVTGNLTPGTSQWQILGLLDVATSFPMVPDAGSHAPPAVFFTTTSNTIVTQPVVDQGTMWGVGVWQQKVYYDANGGTNPNLSLGDPMSPIPTCLNPRLYPPMSYTIWPSPGSQNPLTWTTVQEQDSVGNVAGDPDSPAVQ